jgi:uncharacterized protein YndB with AHSA1/START domain
MATIHHQIAIAAPVAKVYAAMSTPEGIGTWWDKQTVTETPEGLLMSHDPGPGHGEVQLRVVELVPNKRVQWECISTHPATSPASAWTGTRFVFELSDGESPPGASSAPARPALPRLTSASSATTRQASSRASTPSPGAW